VTTLSGADRALLLLGPSGAGKSQLGESLQDDLGLLWIEADLFGDTNPFAHLGLWRAWDALHRHAPARLRDALYARARVAGRSGAVLTLSSVNTIAASQMEKADAAGLHCIILFGSPEDCLRAFLEREQRSGRGLNEGHWLRCNSPSFPIFSAADVAKFRLSAFTDGRHRDRAALVADVRQRLDGRVNGGSTT
jgi:hypothetical protein